MTPAERAQIVERLRSTRTDSADVEAKRAATAVPRSLRPSCYRGEGMVRGSYLRVNDGDHRMTS